MLSYATYAMPASEIPASHNLSQYFIEPSHMPEKHLVRNASWERNIRSRYKGSVRERALEQLTLNEAESRCVCESWKPHPDSDVTIRQTLPLVTLSTLTMKIPDMIVYHGLVSFDGFIILRVQGKGSMPLVHRTRSRHLDH